MDAKQNHLDEKLADLLKQVAEVASQIQAQEQGPGTPHFDQIEIPAHEVGQRLSQMIQSTRATDVALEHARQMKCPDCGETGKDVYEVDEHGDRIVVRVITCPHCRRLHAKEFTVPSN